MTGLKAQSVSNEAIFPTYCDPQNGGPLNLEGNFLVGDRQRFEIRDGIPRFVSASNYADAFGLQWNRYRTTQLDSVIHSTDTADRLKRCLGEALWNDLSGKLILEAGCGAGRFTEILLAKGALVQSVDLSSAVEANQKNCPQGPAHRIAQADITQLPFLRGQFDIVLCLGVVQHTPSPELTMKKLAEQVKPGGSLVIDHYTYSLSYYTKLAPLVRLLIKDLSIEKQIRITEGLVNFFLPLHRRVRNFPVLQALLSRISPVLCYYRLYPELSLEVHREWALVDTHDSLTDHYKHFRTRGQIERALKSLNMEIEYCAKGGNGIEARARAI